MPCLHFQGVLRPCGALRTVKWPTQSKGLQQVLHLGCCTAHSSAAQPLLSCLAQSVWPRLSHTLLSLTLSLNVYVADRLPLGTKQEFDACFDLMAPLQVVQLHRSFLTRALSGLLLSQPRILRLIWSISQLAGAYCRAVSTALPTPAHTSPHQPPSRQGSAGLGAASGPGTSGAAATAGRTAGAAQGQGAGAGVGRPGVGAAGEEDGLAGADSMAGVSSIFSANLSTLVLELQQLYEVLMRREGAGAEAVESMQAEVSLCMDVWVGQGRVRNAQRLRC